MHWEPCASWMRIFLQADFCTFYFLHCIYLFLSDTDLILADLCIVFSYFIIMYWVMLPDADWRCLTPTLLVIVLSVLCGWVPLYWCSTCWFLTLMYAPPQPLYARVGVRRCSGWLIRGNRRTCSHGLVRSLLSGSDGLWCEESDHINVLRIQAASKPH